MPDFSRFYGIIVRMYFDDHAPLALESFEVASNTETDVVTHSSAGPSVGSTGRTA